jgi:hypothetical protein
VDSHFNETGETIPGLGTVIRWNTISPRVGVNLKLADDGSMVLRGIVGRYYDPLTLTSLEAVHPGVAITTLARYDPATAGYTNIISVTDPRANIAVDPNMKAPFTDQYSVGLDRRLIANLAASVSYVHKHAANQLATLTTGATYGTQQVASPLGGTLTVFPLTSRANDRVFLTTNGPGYFTNYDALLVSVTKRYSHRWQGNVGYGFAKLRGLTAGAVDPNDVTNAEGPQGIDRPNMFTATAAYDLPKVDVQVSGNLVAVSGTPYAPVIQVALPQGRRNVNIAVPGSYRGPAEQHLYLRVSKMLFKTDHSRLELSGELRNALQDTALQSRVTTVYGNPNFGLQSSWPDPRQLLLRARMYF